MKSKNETMDTSSASASSFSTSGGDDDESSFSAASTSKAGRDDNSDDDDAVTLAASSSSSRSSSLLPRIASGSIGSIVTALAVTPLEVVKVRQQAVMLSSSSSATRRPPTGVFKCPRGCGTFVLNNGLMDCVLPKSAVPYFDKFGNPTHIEYTLHPDAIVTNKGNSSGSKINMLGTKFVQGTQKSSTSSNSSGGSGRGQKHAGTFKTLRRIFRTEGLSGIYAGLRPTLVMSVPNTVLYFTAYDEIVSRLRTTAGTLPRKNTTNAPTDKGVAGPSVHSHHHSSLVTSSSTRFDMIAVPLIGGSSARFIASIVTSPLELLRTRQASLVGSAAALSASSPMNNSMLLEFRKMIQSEGFFSLYKGLAPTLWRDVPFSAIYWLFLEQFKMQLRQTHNEILSLSGGSKEYLDYDEELPAFVQAGHAFVSGAAAGMIAAFATTPFDVVKTRRQMVQRTENFALASTTRGVQEAVVCDHGGAIAYKPHHDFSSSGDKPAPARPAGTFAYMREILHNEGISGLWRGNQTRMIKVAPSCAIMISCYELGKRVLE